MKKETYASKLAALLGLEEVKEKIDQKKQERNGNLVGISEEEIQEFRAVQGLIYFLQAPELFTARVCKHCGEHFFVSRKYVAFCSYHCIRKDLNQYGFEWRKGDDLETLVKESYEGNEPIWIHNLEKLQAALEYLTANYQPSTPVIESSLTVTSPRAPSGRAVTFS